MNDKLDTILSIIGDSKCNEVEESDTRELLCDEVKRKHVFLSSDEKKALKRDSNKYGINDLIEKYGVSRRTVKRILND